jgi:hypothetical protein
MGTVSCRNCNGSGRVYDRKSGKTFDCRACGGSGINRNLWSTNCERCRKEIVYKANTDRPRFCKECSNIEQVRKCAKWVATISSLCNIGGNNVLITVDHVVIKEIRVIRHQFVKELFATI